MNLNLDHLVIEVTRKCNMQCSHCCRGASQRKTIPDNYIYKMLQLIDNVSTLTISGGEPTLAMDSLEQIRNCTAYGNCDVQNFYMVTNGKSINVDSLASWAMDMRNCCTDNELSSIGFSFDSYHIDTFNRKQAIKQMNNFYRLKEKLEYEYGILDTPAGGDFIIKHSDENWDYQNLKRQGRAEYSGCNDVNIYPFEMEYYNEEDDTIHCNEADLYLSCNGFIVAGCNWSYHSIDNRQDIRVGHIDDINCTDDLIEAMKRYNKKQKYRVVELSYPV